MPAQWTGEIVGKMHAAKIEHRQLAKRLKVTPEYVSMVLNGKREPEGAEIRFNTALDELLNEAEATS